MKHSLPTAIIVIASILAPAVAAPRLGADDLSFHEAGARAAALGGAFTARADDVSSLFYNPAALAFLGSVRFKTNLTLGKRSLTAAWPESPALFRSDPFEIGGAHAVAWQPFRRATLGIGLFSPFSFDSRWPEGWSAGTVSQSARVRSHYIRSVLAVELFKGFSVSAGLDVVSSSLEWRHDVAFNMTNYPLPSDALIDSRHTLSGRGTGSVFGALWKISPAIQVGARYQSRVAIDYEGENHFYIGLGYDYVTVPDPVQGTRYFAALLDLFYAPQDVTCGLTLPREIAFGVALRPLSRLSISFDIEWDRWTEFGEWAFRSVNEGGVLSPEFTAVFEEFYGVTPDYGTQGVTFELGDTRRIKAGLEFHPSRYLALRAGMARHESSTDAENRSPVYPDLDRTVFSFGFGYEGPVFSIWDEDERVSDLSFDLFVRYAPAERGESAFPSFGLTYDSNRLIVGVGVGFAF